MYDLPDQLGPYDIIEPLGEGGAGVVVRAKDRETGVEVSLKLLHPAVAADDIGMGRIRREVTLSRRLTHPGLARVFDLQTFDLTTVLVSEYVEGRSLKELIDENPGVPLESERALRIIMQLTDALAAAHDEGIVHRDLKPANVILGPQDRVKIIDFGSATAADVQELTAPGMIVGTIDYIAPETWGGKGASPAADVWALGTIAYRLITGRMPFEVRADYGVYEAVRRGPARPIQQVAPQLPKRVANALMGALRRTVKNRYPHARDFHRKLTRAVFDPEGDLDDAEPFDPPETSAEDVASIPGTLHTISSEGDTPPGPSRRVTIAAAITVALVCGGVALAILLRLYRG